MAQNRGVGARANPKTLFHLVPQNQAARVTAPLHTCSGSIGLESVIPGAMVTVKIENGSILVSQQARRGPADTLALQYPGPLPAGAWINVWQDVAVPGGRQLSSPITRSGPIEDLHLTNPLPSVQICDAAWPGYPARSTKKICVRNTIAHAVLEVEGPGPIRSARQGFNTTVFSWR